MLSMLLQDYCEHDLVYRLYCIYYSVKSVLNMYVHLIYSTKSINLYLIIILSNYRL